jgi:hypothetical protein
MHGAQENFGIDLDFGGWFPVRRDPEMVLHWNIPLNSCFLNGSVGISGDERAAVLRTTSRILVSKKCVWNCFESRGELLCRKWPRCARDFWRREIGAGPRSVPDDCGGQLEVEEA